ncbi:MAG: DUF4129 domain-containing protein [Bacillota bacterium]|nr:DUF4129 domain-containing protein [Bacillota bacterium]
MKEDYKEDYEVLITPESWKYRNNNKSLPIELLHEWILFSLAYAAAALIICGIQGQGALYQGLLMFLPIALTVCLNRRITSASVYFAVNLAVIAACAFLFPYTSVKIIYVLIHGRVAVSHFLAKKNNTTVFFGMGMMLVSAGVSVVSFIAASKMDSIFLKNFVTLAAVNSAVCMLIYYHITRRDILLTWEQSFASILAKRMKKVSVYVISVMSALIIFFNLALWKLGIFSALDSLIKIPQANLQGGEVTNTIPAATQESGMLPIIAPEGTSRFGNMLSNILEAMVIIIVVPVLVYLLTGLIIKVKNTFRLRFGRIQQSNEKREFIFDEAAGLDLKQRLRKVRKVLEDRLDFSNRKRIRGLYRKFIKKYRGKGVEPAKYETAGELQHKIEKVSSKDYEELTQIYHKARYGNQECSDEELDRMKGYL